MSRTIARLLGALGLTLALCGGVGVSPAAAECGVGSSAGCGEQVTTTTNTGYYMIPQTSCAGWVSSSGMGGGCAAPGSYLCEGCPPALTWRQIIDRYSANNTFDPCRLDKLGKGFTPPPPPPDAEKGSGKEWLVRLCMTGYDLNTTDGGPNIDLQVDRVWREYQEPPGWTAYLWGDVAEQQGTFPFPVLGFGPQPLPVVGTPTFFWADFRTLADDGTTQTSDLPYVVPLGNNHRDGEPVRLLAQLTRLLIDTGEGKVEACGDFVDQRFVIGEDTVEDFAKTSKCQYTFEHSSASEPGQVHKVTATAIWRVGWAKGQGQITPLSDRGYTTVETRMVHEIPVQEIQVRDCVIEELCNTGDGGNDGGGR